MTVIALDVKQVRDYTLKGDGSEEKTIFMIGVLDGRLLAYIDDQAKTFALSSGGAVAPGTVHFDVDQANYKKVRFGLKGWKNFRNSSGVEMRFESEQENVPGVGFRTCATHECMDMITPFIAELAEAILSSNRLSGVEIKN